VKAVEGAYAWKEKKGKPYVCRHTRLTYGRRQRGHRYCVSHSSRIEVTAGLCVVVLEVSLEGGNRSSFR